MAPAMISSFMEEWRSLTNWCKGLLILAVIQTIVLIGFSIATMILFAVNLPFLHASQTNASLDVNKEIAYGLLVIVSSIFFVYFAFDAVMNENKFEMVAFGGVSILLTVRIIYMCYSQFVRVPAVDSVTWFTLAVMIFIVIFQVLLIICFIRAWKDFGWKLYKTVGANKNLIAYFRDYQVFLSLMKVDLQFGVSLVMLSGFFLFSASSSVALWLNVVVIVLSFAWAIFSWQMVIREFRVGMVFVFAFAVAEPAYIIYKIISFYAWYLFPASQRTDCTYTPCILFTVSGILAVIVRVAVVVFAVKCMQNFDRGMKKVFGTDGGKDDKTPASGPPSLSGRPSSLNSIALSTNPRSTLALSARMTPVGTSSVAGSPSPASYV